MRYFSKMLFLQFFLLLIVPLIVSAKLCSGSDSYTSGNYTSSATVSWGTSGSDCCSPNPGPALVQYSWSVYSPEFGWIHGGSQSYYITIEEAQYAAGCIPMA
jgi:hypothetical protein